MKLQCEHCGHVQKAKVTVKVSRCSVCLRQKMKPYRNVVQHVKENLEVKKKEYPLEIKPLRKYLQELTEKQTPILKKQKSIERKSTNDD